MTKLYTVRVAYDYVVVAEDEQDAEDIGREHIRDALFDLSTHDIDLDIVEGVHAFGWDDQCIPYGGDGNTRTSEYKKNVN